MNHAFRIPGIGDARIWQEYYSTGHTGNPTTMISITDTARSELLQRGADQGFIRIVIQSGGCSGMTYHADIVSTRNDDEKIIKRDGGLTFITNDESLPYLMGVQMDYSEDLITAGFRFHNASKSSCGCGASFSAAGMPMFPSTDGAGCGT